MLGQLQPGVPIRITGEPQHAQAQPQLQEIHRVSLIDRSHLARKTRLQLNRLQQALRNGVPKFALASVHRRPSLAKVHHLSPTGPIARPGHQ